MLTLCFFSIGDILITFKVHYVIHIVIVLAGLFTGFIHTITNQEAWRIFEQALINEDSSRIDNAWLELVSKDLGMELARPLAAIVERVIRRNRPEDWRLLRNVYLQDIRKGRVFDEANSKRNRLAQRLEDKLLEMGYSIESEDFQDIQALWHEYASLLNELTFGKKNLQRIRDTTSLLLDKLKTLMERYAELEGQINSLESDNSKRRQELEKQVKDILNEQDLIRNELRAQVESLEGSREPLEYKQSRSNISLGFDNLKSLWQIISSSGLELAQRAKSSIIALLAAREEPVKLLKPMIRNPGEIQKKALSLSYGELIDSINKLTKEAKKLIQLSSAGLILEDVAPKASALYWLLSAYTYSYFIQYQTYYEPYDAFDFSMYSKVLPLLLGLAEIFTRSDSSERNLLVAPLFEVAVTDRKLSGKYSRPIYNNDLFKRAWMSFKEKTKLPIDKEKILAVEQTLTRVNDALSDTQPNPRPAGVTVALFQELSFLQEALANLFANIPVLALALPIKDLKGRLENWITIADTLTKGKDHQPQAHYLPDIVTDNLKTYVRLYQ
ncbi:MAG TPA: hypothetical protein VHA52_11530, partial [Candidatus Babeliaceae bacterium]|nr:hypothetical protein [Candidatus Babeliaceae bacterium]